MTSSTKDFGGAAQSQKDDPVPSRVLVIIFTTSIAFLGSTLVVLATWRGIGVTTDGTHYLRMAHEFADNWSLHVEHPRLSATHYPPGWPFLVGATSAFTGVGTLTAARLLNVAVVASISAVAIRAMAGSQRPVRWMHVAGGAFIALNYGILGISARALTDALFLLLFGAVLLLLERFLAQSGWQLLVLLTVLGSTLILVRYVGVVIAVPTAAAIARQPWDLPRKLGATTAVGATMVVPAALWNLTGPNSGAGASHLSSTARAGASEALESLEEFAATLITPTSGIGPLDALAGAAALLTPLAAVVALVLAGGGRVTARRSIQRIRAVALEPWILAGTSYLLLVAAQRWWIDREIIARYWLPVLFVSVVVTIRCVEALASGVADSGATWRRIRTVITVLFVAAALANLFQATRAAASNFREGDSKNEVRYQDSMILSDIRNRGGVTAYSDTPTLIDFHAPEAQSLPIEPTGLCGETGNFDEAILSPGTVVVVFGPCQEIAEARILAARPDSQVRSEANVGTIIVVG